MNDNFENRELEAMQEDLGKGKISKSQYYKFLILTGRYKIYEGSINDDYQINWGLK